MYAIVFDLDTSTLSRAYGSDSYNNAYADIRKVLTAKDFVWQQGSVYFGREHVRPSHCFRAVIQLTNTYNWFASSVRDIRMLRIEEQDDLKPFIEDFESANGNGR